MYRLHMMLMVAQNCFQRVTSQKAAKRGLLPGQPKVMEYIYNHDQCSQTNICEAWNLDKATVSELVDSLVKRNLVEKRRSEEDKRTCVLQLTAEGQELWKPMQDILKNLEVCAWKGIDEMDQQIFLEVLQKISDNMRETWGDGDESV